MEHKHFQCLNCGTIFQRTIYQNGKFCSGKCYQEYRVKNPLKWETAQAIPVEKPGEFPLVDQLLKENAEKTDIAPVPLEEKPQTIETPVTVSPIEINESIASDIRKDLLTIRDTVDNLLQRVEDLEKKEQEVTPLENMVQEFVGKFSEYNKHRCYTCRKPVEEGKTFCGDTCARDAIPAHAIMRMNDGHFVGKRAII